MVKPFTERIEQLKHDNPKDEAEGMLAYAGRINSLAEEELLKAARNKWNSWNDKLEALCQLIEHCRVKNYNAKS
jgi:hypothetical protein